MAFIKSCKTLKIFKSLARTIYAKLKEYQYRILFRYEKIRGRYYSLIPNSIWEHCHKFKFNIKNLLPAKEYDVCYEASVLLDDKVVQEKRIKKLFLPLYTVELPNAIVIGEDSDMIIHDKELLTDRFYYSPTDKGCVEVRNPFFRKLEDGRLVFAEKTHITLKCGIFLNTRWCGNIYHFIYDAMLKLQWIENDKQYADFPILLGVHSLDEPSRVEILRKINSNGHKVIVLDGNKIYRVENLLVISIEHFFINEQYVNGAPWYGGFYRYDSLLKFRNLWLSDSKKGTSKYYLTRPSNDRLINENEIADFFKKHGFLIVNPGLYTYEEQVKIFQEAKWIVAMHGASLCNIVHCPSNAVIIQITSDSISQNLDYNNIASGIGIRLINVYGELVSQDNSWTARGIKMKLSLATAQKILDYLCSTE